MNKELIALNGPKYDGIEVSLGIKHKLMAEAIGAGMSNTQARLAAGFTDYTTREPDHSKAVKLNADYAHRLLKKNPDILIYAKYLSDQKRAKLSLTVEDLYKHTAAIINFDPAMLFEKDGTPIQNMWDIDPIARAAIKKFKALTRYDNEGNPVSILEVEFYSKNDAMNTLVKMRDISNGAMDRKVQGTGKKVTLTKY